MPGTRSLLINLRSRTDGVVQSDAGDVIAHSVTNPERYPINIARIDRPRAQVHEKILALHRPIPVELNLGASAYRVAHINLGLAKRICRWAGREIIGRSRLHEIKAVLAFAISQATGDV